MAGQTVLSDCVVRLCWDRLPLPQLLGCPIPPRFMGLLVAMSWLDETLLPRADDLASPLSKERMQTFTPGRLRTVQPILWLKFGSDHLAVATDICDEVGEAADTGGVLERQKS